MHKNASIWCDGRNHFVLEVKYYAFICKKKKKKNLILVVIFCFANLKVKGIKYSFSTDWNSAHPNYVKQSE